MNTGTDKAVRAWPAPRLIAKARIPATSLVRLASQRISRRQAAQEAAQSSLKAEHL